MKWYEDPVYIKMCDCPEIQNTPMPVETIPLQRNVRLASGAIVWLPTQSDLQEMIKYPYYGGSNTIQEMRPLKTPEDIVDSLIDFIEWQDYSISDYAKLFTSMEQLWLAFVLKKEYGKVWGGDSWSTPEVG